jgi:heme/copper-type cytochrome/quinol oxidase subunit 1
MLSVPFSSERVGELAEAANRYRPRRLSVYSPVRGRARKSLVDWYYISSIGSYISAIGLIVFLVGIAHALGRKIVATANPWV